MKTNEVNDLSLRETQTRYVAELTEDRLEITVLDHPTNSDRRLDSCRTRYIETPVFKLGIDVAEHVNHLCNGLCAIVRRKDEFVTVREWTGIYHTLFRCV